MEGKLFISFKLKYTHPMKMADQIVLHESFQCEGWGVMVCSISKTNSQELLLLYGQWPLLHPNDVGISWGCWWIFFSLDFLLRPSIKFVFQVYFEKNIEHAMLRCETWRNLCSRFSFSSERIYQSQWNSTNKRISMVAVLFFTPRNVISLKRTPSTCLVLNASSALVRSEELFWC